MTGELTVAVITPVFNPGPHLGEALRSLIGQTESRWECVVVDDGSDEPLDWVSGMDPRIMYIRQANQGTSAARNRGIAETSAPLLAFLDQDDRWEPGYLAAQVKSFATTDDVVLSSTAFEIIDESGRRVGPGFEGHNASYDDLLRGCGLALSTVMARRSAVQAVGGFRDFRISQDWDLWLRVARRGGVIARVDRVLGAWRQHPSNQSRNYVGLWREAREILAPHSHPAARDGLRRVRLLSAAQAFDRARAAPRLSQEFVFAFAWAVTHAPGYVARSMVSSAGQRRRRWQATDRPPPTR